VESEVLLLEAIRYDGISNVEFTDIDGYSIVGSFGTLSPDARTNSLRKFIGAWLRVAFVWDS
jgi:hypothetical protein